MTGASSPIDLGGFHQVCQGLTLRVVFQVDMVMPVLYNSYIPYRLRNREETL
jgi:hypothetical protein